MTPVRVALALLLLAGAVVLAAGYPGKSGSHG